MHLATSAHEISPGRSDDMDCKQKIDSEGVSNRSRGRSDDEKEGSRRKRRRGRRSFAHTTMGGENHPPKDMLSNKKQKWKLKIQSILAAKHDRVTRDASTALDTMRASQRHKQRCHRKGYSQYTVKYALMTIQEVARRGVKAEG